MFVFSLHLPTLNDHRTIESFYLEEIFHLVQRPCSEQGHLQLDHVVQSSIQSDLKCLQEWDIHHFSGQPVPVPLQLYCKKFLPYILSKSLPFKFETISPCPVTTQPAKESVPFFFIAPSLDTEMPLSGLLGAFFFSRLNSSSSLSLSS